MKFHKTMTIFVVLILLFSLNITVSETVGVTITSGNGASISDVSMSNDYSVEAKDSPHFKETNDLINERRVKSVTEGLPQGGVQSRLNSLYGLKGSNDYEMTGTKGNPTVRELNQLIITFSSNQAKDEFVQDFPSDLLVRDFNLIPSIVVAKDNRVNEFLLKSDTIVDLTSDIVFDMPSYEVSEKDLYNTAYFSSEGRIGAWDLHDLGYTGKGVTISVLDTGIDANHQDLMYTSDGSPKIIAQQSFVPGEGVQDFIGHGTHVAGTTAGNGYHIGMAPDAQLLNAKVCSFGGCATSWMLEAIEWSIEQEVDIITMSIGGSTFFGIDPLDYIIDYAWQEGIVLTIAAGNSGPSVSTVQSPGTGPSVITVGATDNYDLVTAFSGRGPSVYGNFDPDLSAPGMGIFSTLPGNTYGIYDGTSMATPHVAGAIALLMEAHPKGDNDDIKANLMANAKDMGEFSSNTQGAGLVDLVATHENWDRRKAFVFPLLSERDTFYLTPGETFTGIFDYIRGYRGFVPKFYLDHSHEFDIDIDEWALKPWAKGHQFVPFSLTVPEDASVGDILERTVTVAFLPFNHHHRFGKFFDFYEMNVVVEVVDPEDDAGLGFDASDTFIGATHVSFSNFTGYANDIDFYKVILEEGMTYTIELGGMNSPSDFDLGVYDENGVLTCEVCNIYFGGTSPEFVELTPTYTGYYYIRVDPWSVLYNDPYLNRDSSGPYTIRMLEGGGGGSDPGDPTGTQLDFIEASIYGVDDNSDGIQDQLAVDVTVDVTSAGLLDAYAFLSLDKGGSPEKWFFAVAFVEFHEFTSTGIQTFTMALDGMVFADQGFTGSVVLYELFMGDPSTFTILHDLFNVYSSPELSSADFGLTHMTYNYLSSQPLDEDGDGVGDMLEVAVSVNIETTYPWFTYFYATLFHPDGYYVPSANEAEIDLSMTGEHVLYFYFFPDEFLTGSTNLLDLELIITYSWDHPMTIETLHFGYYPYILTIGDILTVNPVDYVAAGGANTISAITDFGFDVDSDGTFDYLVLQVTVTITDPGYYSASFHPWVWSIPGQEVLFDFESDPYNTIQWLDSGTHDLFLTVSGELINGMRADAPLMFLYVWLDAWEEYEWGFEIVDTPDEYQNYVTNDYDWTDFDNAGVRYLGVSGVNYVDFNGDGEAETVEVILEVEVGYAGDFYFFFAMYDYPLGGYLFFDIYDGYWYFDTPGTHTISIFIDGRQLWMEEFTGNIEFWEIDIFNAMTNEITYFDFQNGLFWVDYTQLPGAAPPGTISDISDYPIDTNSNGLYEYVAIDVKIDVRSEAYFYMYMDVWAGEGFFDYVGFYYTDFYADIPGQYIVTILIPSTDILANVFADSTALELWLYLFDDFGLNDEIGPVYTGVYDLSFFERPAYIASISDSGVDNDENGLFEQLKIMLTIEVTTPGEYYIDLETYIGETGEWVGYSFAYFDAPDPGTYMVDLFISGASIIGSSSVDYTNFILWILLSNNDGLVDLVMDYPTDYYFVSDFEYSALITDVNDFGLDSNGNGLYEGVNVQLTVNVNIPGDYFLNMDVYSGVTFNWIGYFYTDLYAPDPGIYTVDLLITGSNIIANSEVEATDFELYITMYDGSGFLQELTEYTNVYTVSDFEASATIADVSDYGFDRDGNSQYEFINIAITLDVTVPDLYFIDLSMYGNDDTGYDEFVVGYSNSYDLDSGIHTLEIMLPTSLILSRLSDDYTNFQVLIWLGSSSGEIDFVEYYTNWYDTEELEMVVAILNVVDFGEDPDSDGLFENLIIEVEMDISKAGIYSIITDLYGDADAGDYDYIGYYENVFTISSAGTYTFPLTIPASDILISNLDTITNFYYYAVVLDDIPYVVTLSGPYYSDYYSLNDFDST